MDDISDKLKKASQNVIVLIIVIPIILAILIILAVVSPCAVTYTIAVNSVQPPQMIEKYASIKQLSEEKQDYATELFWMQFYDNVPVFIWIILFVALITYILVLIISLINFHSKLPIILMIGLWVINGLYWAIHTSTEGGVVIEHPGVISYILVILNLGSLIYFVIKSIKWIRENAVIKITKILRFFIEEDPLINKYLVILVMVLMLIPGIVLAIYTNDFTNRVFSVDQYSQSYDQIKTRYNFEGDITNPIDVYNFKANRGFETFKRMAGDLENIKLDIDKNKTGTPGDILFLDILIVILYLGTIIYSVIKANTEPNGKRIFVCTIVIGLLLLNGISIVVYATISSRPSGSFPPLITPFSFGDWIVFSLNVLLMGVLFIWATINGIRDLINRFKE